MTRLICFSHPNHELPVLGLVQRWRPRLVYLTDEGGEGRVADTHRGLEFLGLSDHATYLRYSEADIQRALLSRDMHFFQGIVGRLSSVLDEFSPEEVYCDAIEFWNPIHDLSIPLLSAALQDRAVGALHEVPLVYQKAGENRGLVLQRMPPEREADRIRVTLGEEELRVKLGAWAEIYEVLQSQMGEFVRDLSPEYIGTEEVGRWKGLLPDPISGARALRYEEHGRALKAQGRFESVITHADHYLPVARALLGI